MKLGALALALILSAGVARPASARCGPEAQEWVRRCATAEAVPMSLGACPAGVAIVELSTAALSVELSRAPKGFRRVGAYGLSPIGDFADWKHEPAARRQAFDALAACVARDPPEALLTSEGAPAASSAAIARLPWLLVVAAVLGALVAFSLRAALRSIGWSAAALLAIVLSRRASTAAAYFHQNGQGPDWIAAALRGDAGEYGPGYPEIFGWIATRARRPDLAVFVAQELLAGTVPVAGFLLVRAAGARRALALAVGALLTLDPVLVRLARSESYFGTIVALLFLAAALLATAFAETRRAPRLAATLGASLLMAQAGRIHPLAWVPCATIPLVVLALPGRRRAIETGGVALVCAAAAALLVLPTMRAALGGALGQGFLPGARALFVERLWPFGLALASVVGLALPRATRPFARPVAVVAFTVVIAVATNVVRADAPVIRGSYLHLFAPTVLVGLAVMARWPAAVGLGFATAVVHGALDRSATVLPTDARELAFALEWRETLPTDAEVAALQRVGDRVLTLPLFPGRTAAGVALSREGEAHFTRANRFYVRTSLCATPEGAPLCLAFESTHTLRPLSRRTFEARASLPWLPVGPRPIEVVVFTVE